MRTIYIDFDGTIVEHKFPDIGEPVPHAIEVIKKLAKSRHLLVLNTVRSDLGINFLKDALKYCKSNGIEFEYWATSKREPKSWTASMISKTNDIFIDDSTPGIPLMPTNNGNGWMVDWEQIELRLLNHGIL